MSWETNWITVHNTKQQNQTKLHCFGTRAMNLMLSSIAPLKDSIVLLAPPPTTAPRAFRACGPQSGAACDPSG